MPGILKFQRFIAYICLLICCSLNAKGQVQENLRFVHFDTKEGLSNSMVKCMAQDKEGFIWVGTADGLNRYDGKHFKVYRKKTNDSLALQDNNINDLLVDSYGDLWIATDRGGLSRYDKSHDRFDNYFISENSVPVLMNQQVVSIAEDKYHQVWVAAYGGLYLYNRASKRFRCFFNSGTLEITDHAIEEIKKDIKSRSVIYFLETFKNQKIPSYQLADWLTKQGNDSVDHYFGRLMVGLTHDCLPTSGIKEIKADTKGNLWVSYTTPFISVVDVKTHSFKHISCRTIKGEQISPTSFFIDDKRIWVGCTSRGVWELNVKDNKFYPIEKLSSSLAYVMAKDRTGNIWVGGTTDVLTKYVPSTGTRFDYSYDSKDILSLPSGGVFDILEDKQGNIWVGGGNMGLNFSCRKNPFMSEKNILGSTASHQRITSIYKIDDELYLGYFSKGLDLINTKTFQKKHFETNVSSYKFSTGQVNCFFKDSKSNFWIGTVDGGLQFYDRKKGVLKPYKNDPIQANSIAGDDIRMITEDHEGNLWIAVHGKGVDKFDVQKQKFTHFRVNYNDLKHSISSDWVFSVCCDNKDRIWVGSVDGISVIDKKNSFITSYKANNGKPLSLSNNIVLSILQDSKGKIWCATNYGLNLYLPEKDGFKVYTSKNGLPNDNVTGIIEDKRSDLWITTYKGLSRYNPKTNVFTNFDVNDGLSTDEFMNPSCFMDKTGNLYFGGRNGLVYFNPDNILKNKTETPVYFTDFKLFYKSIQISGAVKTDTFELQKSITFTKELVLEHDKNVFSFEFAGLNYTRPEKNEYAYKMEGFDKDWTMIGNKNEITYTNLHAGTYILKVKAANNDGVWTEKYAEIKLIIKPPWWKTIWAYLLYSATITILAYYFTQMWASKMKLRQDLYYEKLLHEKEADLQQRKLAFFTNITHELRTPLTLIIGPTLRLIEKFKKDEEVSRQLSLIRKNAEKQLKLINELLDLRKFEAGKMDLKIKEENLADLVHQVSSYFSDHALIHNIDLKTICPNKQLSVWIDKDKMEKVLVNLLSNAFKFTPDGGLVRVDVEDLTNEGKPYVRILVADSGIGITKDALAHVFDPYYSSSRSNLQNSTGIGLSLSKEIVELHHGRLTVASVEGEGAEFVLEIPLGNQHFSADQLDERQESEEVQNTDARLFTNNASKRKKQAPKRKTDDAPIILIVEDNDELRQFLKQDLEERYQVFDANNGSVALALALEKQPDLIISDVMMPVMDGIELCKQLKDNEKTSHIPIILLTAKSTIENRIEGLESGADSYIPKPFHPDHLDVRIRKLIEQRSKMQVKNTNDFVKYTHTTAPQFKIEVKEKELVSSNELFLKKAVSIVERNLANSEFNVDRFSELIGMNYFQLHRKLKALTNMTTNDFIQHVRLKVAANLLLKNKYTITEICYEVGFSSPSYFTKCFREVYGLTPSQYIEKQVS